MIESVTGPAAGAMPECLLDDREVVLQIAGVTKRYRSQRRDTLAVADISLTVRRGETVALVGPSGCGKSTLLRLIAGLIPVTAGEVFVDGVLVNGVPLDLAMLPQNYSQALLPWRTVLGNVLLPFESKRRRQASPGVRRSELKERAERYIEQVGLRDFIGVRPSELSGGMQQRVLLARALMTGANMLLMDEPFSALDAVTRLSSQDLVRQVLQDVEPALTAVLVTHDAEEALYMSDRVVVLTPGPGRIAQIIETGLGRKRDQIETRATSRFLELRAQLLTAVGVHAAPESSQPLS